jgi:hypothetical protein
MSNIHGDGMVIWNGYRDTHKCMHLQVRGRADSGQDVAVHGGSQGGHCAAADGRWLARPTVDQRRDSDSSVDSAAHKHIEARTLVSREGTVARLYHESDM